jgi:RNase H-like domain found in reverse transcriptase
VNVINDLIEPETKKQLRQIIGIFSLFRDYTPDFASVAKPLTDLISKRVSDRIPFGHREREAFCMLKSLLCKAANEPLGIVDHTRQLSLFVDASDITVGAALTQCDNQGRFRSIAYTLRCGLFKSISIGYSVLVLFCIQIIIYSSLFRQATDNKQSV